MLAPISRVLTVVVAATAVVAAPALATPAHTTREGVTSLRRQIDSREVKAATVYTARHIIHASVAGGKRYSVDFKPAERRTLVASLLSHHVRFHILKGHAAHHGLRRRYIALIILGGLALLAVLTVLVFRRRGGGQVSPPPPVRP